MDYHLDWIHAALFLSFAPESLDESINKPYVNDGVLTGNQRDADLLVAFQSSDGIYHLLIVEAKGAGRWQNKPLKLKIDRLREIFGADGNRWPNVRPYFIVTSPKESVGLHTNTWPKWATRDGKALWLELGWPKSPLQPTRCDKDGKQSRSGEHWKLMSKPKPDVVE